MGSTSAEEPFSTITGTILARSTGSPEDEREAGPGSLAGPLSLGGPATAPKSVRTGYGRPGLQQGPGQGQKTKRTRQSPCRARKVKCDGRPPGVATSLLAEQWAGSCSNCQRLKMRCTFEPSRTNRGPPNQYVRKLREEGGMALEGNGTPTHESASRDGVLLGSNPCTRSSLVIDRYPPLVSGGASSVMYGQVKESAWHPVSFLDPTDSQTNAGLASSEHVPANLDTAASLYTSPVSQSQPRALPSNPLDAVVPRDLLLRILDLHFAYIHAIVPCVHKPSFMSDIQSRREEQPDQEEWTTLVLVIVSSALAQLPSEMLPIAREDARTLVVKITEIGNRYIVQEFQIPTLTRCIIHYLLVCVQFSRKTMGAVTMHSCISLLTALRLHESQTYHRMNFIEREMSRRIYWLCYGGEKAVAIMEAQPILMNEEDYGDVPYPAELHDEHIEADKLFHPGNDTPLMVGFCYISKMLHIMGRVLSMRRGDRRSPPSGINLELRLEQVMASYRLICHLMDNCPAALRLDAFSGGHSDAWNEIGNPQELSYDPSKPKSSAQDAFLVQQGNIYVTQQMARLLVLQHRDELISLRDSDQTDSMISRRSRWRECTDGHIDIAGDLLIILQSIPIHIIAVNSMSLLSKVRFVASTLLDALSEPDLAANGSEQDSSLSHPQGHAQLAEKSRRAQSYLWDFLRILGEIEGLGTLAQAG